MCTTNVSPTAVTGSPVASINIPELSIATWPSGLRSTAKMAAGSALMVRCTSMRSVVISASCHGRDVRAPTLSLQATGRLHLEVGVGQAGGEPPGRRVDDGRTQAPQTSDRAAALVERAQR